MLKGKEYKCDYCTGAPEVNSCSRVVDKVVMGEIAFETQAESDLDAH